MKTVVQYTDYAKVIVANQSIGEINRGFVVFCGVESTDMQDNVEKMARKIAKLRIIPDDQFKLNLDLAAVNGSVLLISQFTLCADTSSNRPNFSPAAGHDQAIELLARLKTELETTYHIPVATGEFGAHMEVEFKNQGPITIYLAT